MTSGYFSGIQNFEGVWRQVLGAFRYSVLFWGRCVLILEHWLWNYQLFQWRSLF